MQTEFRSLAIDDLLRKLEANEGVEGLAKCGVPSQSEAGQDRVHTPSISARSDPARKELSQSPANQGQAGELFGKNQLPQSPAVILATVQAPSEQEWAPKFGYLPSPKFFYSLIGDAVLLVGLFLLLTYGCPRS
jgi:hypothetical protein